MPKQEFPFPMPNGWFCISRSDEIKPGEVKSLKFCDNQVVAFRTESGEATVLMLLPHLGAHLGEGVVLRVKPLSVLFMHGVGIKMVLAQRYLMQKFSTKS